LVPKSQVLLPLMRLNVALISNVMGTTKKCSQLTGA
jgi:hypothetical protein